MFIEKFKHAVETEDVLGGIMALREIHNLNVVYDELGQKSPLMYVARKGSTELVETVLGLGVDVNLTNSNGYQAIHAASCSGVSEVVKLLLQEGANIGARTDTQRGVLHYNCMFDYGNLLDMLVKHGADVNEVEEERGATCLHLAARYKLNKVAKNLVLNGALLNVKDKQGRTPLHIASQANNIVLVRLLLENGASTHILTLDGRPASSLTTDSECLNVFRENVEEHIEYLNSFIRTLKT